jgi:hypothetical protein
MHLSCRLHPVVDLAKWTTDLAGTIIRAHATEGKVLKLLKDDSSQVH